MNCEPGDLAVMVSGAPPRNIGVWMRVIRLSSHGVWRVRLLTPAMTRDQRRGVWSQASAGQYANCVDARMQPIRGLHPEMNPPRSTPDASTFNRDE